MSALLINYMLMQWMYMLVILKHHEKIVRNAYSNPPLIHGFACRGFSYPWSTAVQKYYMENSGNTQFISFKLHADLSRVMKSQPVPLHPTGTWLIPRSGVSTLHTLPACYSLSSRLSSRTDSWGITVFVLKSPLLYLRMAPKWFM